MIARPLLPGAPILAFPGWPVGYPSCLHKRVSLSHSGTLIRKSPAASARDCENRAGKNRELLGGKEPGELHTGVRSDGRQHVGQDYAARVSKEDRRSLRQGATRVVDGPRDSDRGGVGGNARGRAGDVLSGGHTARA